MLQPTWYMLHEDHVLVAWCQCQGGCTSEPARGYTGECADAHGAQPGCTVIYTVTLQSVIYSVDCNLNAKLGALPFTV